MGKGLSRPLRECNEKFAPFNLGAMATGFHFITLNAEKYILPVMDDGHWAKI